MTLLFEQLLNGLQFGAMLFMLAAGLTLIFGIMGVVNLTHGSFYGGRVLRRLRHRHHRLVPRGRTGGAAGAGCTA